MLIILHSHIEEAAFVGCELCGIVFRRIKDAPGVSEEDSKVIIVKVFDRYHQLAVHYREHGFVYRYILTVPSFPSAPTMRDIHVSTLTDTEFLSHSDVMKVCSSLQIIPSIRPLML
jgi:hypothetical protein